MAVEGVVEMNWVVGAGEVEMAGEGGRALAAALATSCAWESVSLNINVDTGVVLDLKRGPGRVDGCLRRGQNPVGTLSLRHVPGLTVDQYNAVTRSQVSPTRPNPSDDMFFPSWLDRIRQSSSFYSLGDERDKSVWNSAYTLCDFGLERLSREDPPVWPSDDFHLNRQHCTQFCSRLHPRHSPSRCTLSEKDTSFTSAIPCLYDYCSNKYVDCKDVGSHTNFQKTNQLLLEMGTYQEVYYPREKAQTSANNISHLCSNSQNLSDNFPDSRKAVHVSDYVNSGLSLEDCNVTRNDPYQTSETRNVPICNFSLGVSKDQTTPEETHYYHTVCENDTELPSPRSCLPTDCFSETQVSKEDFPRPTEAEKDSENNNTCPKNNSRNIQLSSEEIFSKTVALNETREIRKSIEDSFKQTLLSFAASSIGRFKKGNSNGNKNGKDSSTTNNIKTNLVNSDNLEIKHKNITTSEQVTPKATNVILKEEEIQCKKRVCEKAFEKCPADTSQIKEILTSEKQRQIEKDDKRRLIAHERFTEKAFKKLIKRKRHLKRDDQKFGKTSHYRQEQSEVSSENEFIDLTSLDLTDKLKDSAFLLEERKRGNKERLLKRSNSSSSILLRKVFSYGHGGSRGPIKKKDKDIKSSKTLEPLKPRHPKELHHFHAKECSSEQEGTKKKGKKRSSRNP